MSGHFLDVARFEVRYYLRRISTWVYFGILAASGFLLVHLAGGAWSGVQVAVSGSGGNVLVNSPYVVAGFTVVMSLFGTLITAALLGNAAYRDYETGIFQLFFTSPVSRFGYLGGRFLGALLVDAVVHLGIPVGLALGSLMPYLDTERFGPFRAMAYLQPYLLLVLPNLVLTGAIFFSLAVLTRKMLPNYVGGVFLLVASSLSSQFLADLDNQRLAAMLDPFGSGALELLTRYWTPAERNAQLLPFADVLLANRLAWMAVGLVIFAAVYFRFRFSQAAAESRARRQREKVEAEAPAVPKRMQLPVPDRSFGVRSHLQQYLWTTRRAFRGIVGNRYFFAIVAAAVLFLVLAATQASSIYGTNTWPVTYLMLDVLGSTFWLFMIIITTFYAGELVWEEREVRINQVHDATPVPNWVPLAAKWTALALMLTLLQVVVVAAGVTLQAVKGYYDFELGLYARSLLGMALLSHLLLSVFVVLVHVVANHKYVGHLIVVAFLVFSAFMGAMGLEHNLYRYNSGSTGLYSDMNGFGPFLAPFFWFKAYWAAWALLFAVVSNLFWVRGQETRAGWRTHLARLRFTRPALSAAAVAAVLILGLGGFIFYNTNVVNQYSTSFEAEEESAKYERLYKRFETTPQPRVVGANLHVEIYPERRDATVRGEYRLLNKTRVAIDSLHVQVPSRVAIESLAPSVAAERVHSDEELGYYIYRLATPLQPGDSLRLAFDIGFVTEGFENAVGQTQLVENGTFFNSGWLPHLGYDDGAELSDDETRRKHGLEPKELMAKVDDPVARQNNYISGDGDWIDFEATVGTSADQIALAPGYLQREWTEGDRRYFHYRMDAPILNFYAFLSARYAVKKDRWNDPSAGSGQAVAIEVYYHPGHEYNLDRMIASVKKSLEYFTENFGPYQHRQVRILEFPRYAAFAQSFPNTIPYSEAIGFIARVEDEDDIDYPFYVTAHEVAHQWWAHQVIGGNVQGSTVMSETLSQYSALMVMEEEYGREQMRKFLEHELDGYLTGRAFERKRELPLLYNEGQGYIHYDKGSLAMYALRDYIGEERLNAALRDYLNAVKFQEPPYTNSLELYGYLQRATPDSLQYVLADLFEHITLYDNLAKGATSTRLPDGRFQVTLELEARKLRADSLGSEQPVEMSDWVDVGVFAAAPDGKDVGKELYLRKHRITGGPQQLKVIVDTEPARAGIDPYHKLIDRNSDDNVVQVKR